MASLASEPSDECDQCLQPLSSASGCGCSRWRIARPAGDEACGEGLLALGSFGPGQLILTDPTCMRVEITLKDDAPTSKQDDEASDAASQPSLSPPLVLTADSAPNAASASVPLLAQLLALLSHSLAPGASPRAQRIGALVCRLYWEPLEQLGERDQPTSEFLRATAAGFVSATEGGPDQEDAAGTGSEQQQQQQQELRSMRVSLMERLLSAIKLNSFMASDPDESSADPAAASTTAGPVEHSSSSISSSSINPNEQRSLCLLLLVASVNHSCAPNAALTGPTPRSIRPIAPGTQVCISYLSATELTWARRERREKLHKAWGFWCRCDRCRSEEEVVEAEEAGSIGGEKERNEA